MENKTKLIRRSKFEPKPGLIISQFILGAVSVVNVWDVGGNKLKYQFTPFSKYFTIYGADVESIYVHYIK